jgi:two-component system response regulator YesN
MEDTRMEIKVFVVDDEERQRHSIVRHVDWKRYHMRVIGESEDAAQALESAKLDPPDLLITDIRLLGTDGLELSSRMKRINPRIHIIMVTGFEEFEYAKTALDIGVDAFLVKPIIFDELNAVLERIYQTEWMGQSKSREEMHLKEQLDVFKPIAQEQFLQEVIHGLIVGEEVVRARAGAFGMFAHKGLRRVLLLIIDMESASPLPKEEQVRRLKGILAESAVIVGGSLLEEQTTTQRGNIVLILQDREGEDFELATESFIERLCLDAGRMDFCKVSIGIGPSVKALSQLSESFRLAQISVNQRLLGGDERTFSWKLLMKQEIRPEKNMEELIGDFFEVLGAGDSQNSLSLLGEILSSISGNIQIQGSKLRSLCLQLISGAYRTAAEIGDANRCLGPEEMLWEQVLDCWEEPGAAAGDGENYQQNM